MLFPDLLYRPNVKAVAGGLYPRRFFLFISNSGLSTTVSSGIIAAPIGADELLLVTCISFSLAPGAAQIARRCRLVLLDENAVNVLFTVAQSADGATAAAASAGVTIPLTDAIYIRPKEQFLLDADFSGAAASNGVTFNMAGIIVPRGNWQF